EALGRVGGVACVLGDGEVLVEADLVCQARERDCGADLPQARAASLFGREVDPDHFDPAGGGPHPAGDGQQQCGAAAAGGAGDGDRVADAGLQVHVAEGPALAAAHAQALQGEGQGGGVLVSLALGAVEMGGGVPSGGGGAG